MARKRGFEYSCKSYFGYLTLSEIVEADKLINFPDRKYKTIYIDPPWPIGNPVLGSMGYNEIRVDQGYSTMSIHEISNLPIFSLTAEECNLFLWTTHTFLREALNILDKWKFKYHCCITWDKISGISICGFHRRTEFLLFGFHGNFSLSQKSPYFPTCIRSKASSHSRKPNIFYGLIERSSPGPRIELFARNRREGWDAWGNEVQTAEQKVLFTSDNGDCIK